MASQIIKQPDGLFAVFSTIVDGWVLVDATGEEIVDYFAERAADDARRSAGRILYEVATGGKPYCQFTMTFDDADKLNNEHCEPVEFGFRRNIVKQSP